MQVEVEVRVKNMILKDLRAENLERSLDDESLKGEFTNALQHSLFISKNNNIITENPPQNISSISKTMAEKISEAVIDVVNECQESVEEQVIFIIFSICYLN